MWGGRPKETAISSPQEIGVLRVRIKPRENKNSAIAEGLKMCTRRPSLFHVTNSLQSTPVAIIRNCRKNQSGLNHKNRLVLRTIGNGPKPSTHLSRRDQHSSMSRTYTKTICAMIRGI